jgi:hypothetical protein
VAGADTGLTEDLGGAHDQGPQSVPLLKENHIMNSSAVIPTLLTLAGVLLGTAATLISQYLSTRVSRQEAAAQRASDLRAERKTAITEFLDAAQRAEHFLDRIERGNDQDEHEAAELMHRLWLSYKCAEIVCSVTMSQKAQDYTLQLHHYVWDGIPKGPGSSSKREARHAFLDAAAHELDPDRTAAIRRGDRSEELRPAGAADREA